MDLSRLAGAVLPQMLPQALWFTHYAEVLDTLEVNASLYRLPRPSIPRPYPEGVGRFA